MKQKIAAALLTISLAGITQIQQHEGTVLKAYQDVVGVWTVCTGSTYNVAARLVETPAGCVVRIRRDLAAAEAPVRAAVATPVTQQQYDQLVSLVFNIGGGAFRRSSLLRELNAGHCLAAAEQFPRWSYARGKWVRGLHNRRVLEQKLFKEDC